MYPEEPTSWVGSTLTSNLTSMALSPESIVLFAPSINLPVNCIVSADDGRDPTFTSTTRPFDPFARLRASWSVALLISMTSESMVITPFSTVKPGVCITLVTTPSDEIS